MTRPPTGEPGARPGRGTRPSRASSRDVVQRWPDPDGRDRRPVRARPEDREPGSVREAELAPLRASWDPIDAPRPRTRSSARPPRGPVRRRSRLGGFLATYGWRAYAVPLLVVVTVLAVFDATQPTAAPATTVAAGAAAPASGAADFGALDTGTAGPGVIGESPSGDGSFNASLATGALPAGGAIPTTGAGTWHVVPGTTPKVGTGSVSTSTYTVEVEDGMDTASFGGDAAFASLVDQTLDDPKSWTGDGRFALQRIDTGTPTFRISLTSQMTVRPAAQCGYSIALESSCFNRGEARVLLNAARWVRGALPFQGDVGSYRQYMVNHEVGHAIGFRLHQPCASQGGLAPIMMQQTFSTSNDDIAGLEPGGVVPANGLSCHYNAWPFPRG